MPTTGRAHCSVAKGCIPDAVPKPFHINAWVVAPEHWRHLLRPGFRRDAAHLGDVLALDVGVRVMV